MSKVTQQVGDLSRFFYLISDDRRVLYSKEVRNVRDTMRTLFAVVEEKSCCLVWRYDFEPRPGTVNEYEIFGVQMLGWHRSKEQALEAVVMEKAVYEQTSGQ